MDAQPPRPKLFERQAKRPTNASAAGGGAGSAGDPGAIRTHRLGLHVGSADGQTTNCSLFGRSSPPTSEAGFPSATAEISTGIGGDPGAIRTRDPQLRRLVLYPAELPGQAGNARGGRAPSPLVGERIRVDCEGGFVPSSCLCEATRFEAWWAAALRLASARAARVLRVPLGGSSASRCAGDPAVGRSRTARLESPGS